ncbi:MAG: hypothetical protein ACFB6R_09250 [Alphaproteobacteria bacterium]
MPIAARDASDRVEQLTILTERLMGLVESEIDYLKSRRPSELASHTAERDKLAAIYAREMTLIRQDRSLIDGAGPSLLSNLKAVTGRFRQALARHDTMLGAMRSVSEGLLKSVAEQAQSRSPALKGYGKDAGRRSGGARPASLALNETV